MAVAAHATQVPSAEDVLKVIAAAVDGDFYRAIYTDLPADVGALWHYRVAGWLECRDPAPWFSVPDYLADHPEVAEAGIEPLFHYLTEGRRRGFATRPSRHAPAYFGSIQWAPRRWTFEALGGVAANAAAGQGRLSREDERAAVSAGFDPDYYLASHPDIAAAGTDPLEHFLMTGWREGRDPHPQFSVRDYLDTYPDVAAAGINPFAHYMLAGRAEGRLGRHDLGFQYDVIARMTPVGDRIATAAARARAARSQPAAALADRLGRLGDLHVTFSHDDYLAHSGGLQMCVRREAERFAQLGCDHLHLHPPTAWPTVRRRDEPGALGVMLNGRSLGVFTAKAIREALAGAVRPRARRSFAIHSLLGHEVDETADILAAAGLAAGYFWLHDFASLCAGFHLQRDDVEDCAAPPPDSAACGICVYGPQRARHLDAHRRLFERLALTVVAPSQTTLEFWRAHTDLSARDLRVLPHAELTPRGPAPATGRTRPFRLAYVGMPVPLKGWPVFRELAESLVGDSRYEFVHLGGRPDAGSRLAFQRVVVSGERPRAMQEKLEEVAADAALIWPLCRETFSFTAYEAAAAGAAVLTGPDSGNVAAFAADPRIGRVFADERALREAFVSGEILSLSRSSRRAVLYDLAFSGLSGDLVAEARA